MNKSVIVILLRLFSALPFATFYSSLQLYFLHIHIPLTQSVSLTGSILALSFGLALVGGFISEKYISNSIHFIFSMFYQAIGCLIFTTSNFDLILCYSTFFLVGSMGMTLSLNMMITKYFKADNNLREKYFFWMYMFLNLGYLSGYSLSGYYALKNQYQTIPFIIILFSVFAIIICLINKSKIDKNYKKNQYKKFLSFSFVLCMLVIILLHFANLTNSIIILAWLFVCTLYLYKILNEFKSRKNEIILFYMLALAALVFWSAYFLAPMALIIFIKTHVKLHYFSISIAPQWIQNINTLIIILGTIFLGASTNAKSYSNSKIYKQFIFGLIMMSLGFAVLFAGIKYSMPSQKIGLLWIVASYILQSFGELLIGPIGYSLIGKLIPDKYHNITTGIWITILGVASSVSSKISRFAPKYTVASNLYLYQHYFLLISISVFSVSLLMLFIKRIVLK